MPKNEFTPAQKKIMNALVTAPGPIDNRRLKEITGSELATPFRTRLENDGYLVVTRGRPLTFQLTDAGRVFAAGPMAAVKPKPPSGRARDRSEFTPNQILALVTLMAEARELTNADLSELAGLSLTGTDNKKLEGAGLVETDRSQRPYSHRLTDKGWYAVRTLHEKDPPAQAGSAIRSLFTLLANVHRALERLQLGHGEFFKQGAAVLTSVQEPAPVASVTASASSPIAVGEVEAAVRSAYHDLAVKPGNWVGLADLRDRLAGVERSTLDQVLRAMARRPGVRIIPVANTKSLSPRDRAAALVIGDEDNHTMSIGAAG